MDLNYNILIKNKKAKKLFSDQELVLLIKKDIIKVQSDWRYFKYIKEQYVYFLEELDEYYILFIYHLDDLNQITKESPAYKSLEKEYQIVLDHIEDGVLVMDGEGRFIRVNKAIRGDMPSEYYIGKTSLDLVESGFTSETCFDKIKKYGKKENMLLKILDSPNMLVTQIPYFENGELKLVVSCERNMTELKILEKQLLNQKRPSEVFQNLDSMLSIYGIENGYPIVAESKVTKKLLEVVQKVAKTNSTLLFQGESGVGKEIFVRIAYLNSLRKDQPFIKINCGAIHESLLEAELFGYEPGAFTGADRKGKAGFFEVANGGTLFLDEIGEIPLDLQVKLLRVIQEREVIRVGSTKPIKLDIRLIVATNKNLKEEVEKGNFRLDLYYRLSVINIEIPPLRERRDDIRGLINYFIKNYNENNNANKSISNSAIRIMERYEWPGNVRELENLIERLAVVTVHDVIDQYDVLECLRDQRSNFVSRNEHEIGFKSVAEYEKELLYKLMKQCNNETARVADLMKISRSTVNRKLKKYGLRS